MSQVLVAYIVPGVLSREKQIWFHVIDTFSLRKRSTMLSAGDIVPSDELLEHPIRSKQIPQPCSAPAVALAGELLKASELPEPERGRQTVTVLSSDVVTMSSAAGPFIPIKSNHLLGLGSDFYSSKLSIEPSLQSANIINIPSESAMLEISDKSNGQVNVFVLIICRRFIFWCLNIYFDSSNIPPTLINLLIKKERQN